MATAAKTSKVVTQVQVVLHLTEEEATCLRDVCARIGGAPKETRRGLMDNIANALDAAGVHRSTDHWEPSDITRGMVFSETPTQRGCAE